MSRIVVVPVKSYSERVPNKNFREISGVPLYRIFPMTLLRSKLFDRVVIDTDSTEIRSWALSVNIEVLDRKPEHATDRANGNTLLRHHVEVFPGHDEYWQAFVTSPYLSGTTAATMVSILGSSGDHDECDSILSVKVLRGAFWDDRGLPINHRPDLMPRSQDLPPIYQEVCGLFGVRIDGFLCSRTRAGRRPYFFPVPAEESLDIDWLSDLPASG